ncbi:hypothetical protein D039_4209B, partial [Vibrio parahaemolyticus EKP-028]
RISFLSGLYSG